ncbi:hypothetical protein [Rugosimonospora africana]|nr:hypothetical protein [Rugosimonospora africana]
MSNDRDRDQDAVTAGDSQRISLSRRDLIRISGGTALAVVALGAIGVSGQESAPASGDQLAGAAGTAPYVPGARLRLVSNSADLLIQDGSPNWWLSPDIWAVPGTDPSGAPGTPAAGDFAYVWARVHNTGKDDVAGVQVRFYWGNPSVQMLYSTLNPIGTAQADIAAGDTQEVLCLVPWHVVTVNNGHECLVVVATLPADPPLPDVVDPVGYPNVAQRNLTLIDAEKSDFHLTLTVSAPPRQDKTVTISSQVGGRLPDGTLATLGLKGRRANPKPIVQVGFSPKPITDPNQGVGDPQLEISVPAGRSVPVYLTVRGGTTLAADEYQLVEVLERQDQQVLGGISFTVVAS